MRQFRHRARFLIVFVAILSVLLAACTDGQPAPAAEQQRPTPAAQAPGQTVQPGAAAPQQAGQPRQGGILTLIGDDPPTLDPALVQDSTSAEYVVEIFSGLVSLSPQLQIVPDLAERWDISADGTVYTFHLRSNARFHDGKPIRAEDIKYSIERSANPRTGSLVADTYLGDIVGVREMLAGQAREISGLKVLDERTVEITTLAPKVYFLAKLTYSTAFVVDRANVEGTRNWTSQPNGSGPFKLKEWRRGDRLVLQRNDNYYLEPAKVDEVRFQLSGGSPMTMYENDEIDITYVGLQDLDRVLDPASPLHNQLLRDANGNPGVPQLSVGYIGFNVTRPPFDDPKVRQALAMAIDKDQIVRVVLRDAVMKADGILPPGMPGYNPNLQGLEYNPERARQLLAESKYAGQLPPITLSMPGAGAAPRGATPAILEMWKTNLGIDVDVEQVEWATFLQDLKAHRFQMYEVGWIADYPDPQDFLDVLFHSQSLENNMGYSNPELDQLLEQARTERDVQKRMEMYQRAEQMIVDDVPWIPLTFGKVYPIVKPWVQGYLHPPMTVPKYRYVSISR